MAEYWKHVQKQKRWEELHRWLNFLTPVDVLVDVGCHDTPPIYWGCAKQRICVDKSGVFPIVPRGKQPAIAIKSDWLDAELPVDADLMLCLQTIEHQKDATVMEFTAKLLDSTRMLIVSVPYKWDRKLTKTHYQDPIDRKKLRRLMHGARPLKEEIVDGKRLLALYKGWEP